jgi:effector-binding domain-containing protein
VYTIGQFSKIGRVSTKTLRYYDDIELLKPVYVEKNSNLKEFSGGLHACSTFVGPYSRLGEAYAKVMNWIEENGYKNVGAPFDIYLVGPQAVQNPEQFVTEVCFPVSK